VKICLLGNATSVHLQRLALGLAARDLDVIILSHKSAEIPGVEVERYAVPPLSLREPRRWTGRVRSYWRSIFRRFDVVNQHFLHDWGFDPAVARVACYVARAYGTDIVLPYGEPPPTAELVAGRIELLRAARVVATAGPRFAATVAEFAGLRTEDIALLPFGVNLELFTPRDAPPTDRAGRCVGFFKGFRPVYGAVDLVQAMPAVLAAVPGVRFELIGDGPELGRCRELAESLGVARAIDWCGRVPHAEVPARIARWDVSVMPSHRESFGVAALESSAMRVPVVATNVGGIPDTVIDGRTGLLVDPGSPADLAAAIVRLLLDEPLRRRMGDAGRAYVEERYAWPRILDDWVAALQRAREAACVMV
jgi:glycosyltransferase involved in cell wall biosynthesis